jgi:hypothetical protein
MSITDIISLSRSYPDRIVRLYKNESNMFFIRFDSHRLENVDGMKLTQLHAFKGGQPVETENSVKHSHDSLADPFFL